ncbi:MAG: polysaccharide biosynthesis/export family protein [Alphaproteobacteria bacterium]
MPLRTITLSAALLALAGCGVIYTAPSVHDGFPFGTASGTDFDVKVVSLSYESAAAANMDAYVPARLPLAFQPGAAAAASAAAQLPRMPGLPPATARRTTRPAPLPDELPPLAEFEAYRIGVADVLLLSMNAPATLADLPGLISAQSKRQGYIVQDDGAIAIPDAGRIRVAGMTMQDAEAEIFQAIVAAGIDPSFSLEIAEFNSQRVSVGGMVGLPQLLPITLKPLYLHEAVELAGGIETTIDPSVTKVHLFRGGKSYRVGLDRLLSDPAARQIPLRGGDSIYVGSEYREAEAQRYFEEQLSLRQGQMQNTQFQIQLEQLSAQRDETAQQVLSNQRELFNDRLNLGAVQRHYAYLTGEVRKQGRMPLPFETSMSLADVLFNEGGINIQFGDFAEIYVLRAETDPQRNGGLTAFHLDAENAVNLAVATQFEIRPNDVVFVSEQPVTSWNRAVSQILPQLILSTAGRFTSASGGVF